MRRFYLSSIAILMLAACSAGTGGPGGGSSRRELASPTGDLPPPTQCAAFVREISGIPLHGDAWTWWDQAAGRFERGYVPRQSAILVLRATDQLPYGHVAIVRRIVGPREITVTHADWGNDDPTRRLVYDSMPVVDVSPTNDWSELRFWNAKARAFGKIYPAYGFIYPRSASLAAAPIW